MCLFAQNIESAAQLRQLTDSIYAANPRAIIAVDEEGGDVTRLFAATGSPSPGNAVLGRIDDVQTTRSEAAQIGWQLRRAGCTVDFAPSVDVNSCADNPVIGTRSFGDSAAAVARHAAAWVSGLQSTGVAATAKHFPGHGDTAQDSHTARPVVDRSLAQLRRRELVPFGAAIEAGVRVVMTSHIVLPQIDPDNPATMSRAIVTDLLRGELGFTGVVVSDALDMAGARTAGGRGAAAVRALLAGCDLLCLGTENTAREIDEIERAVAQATSTDQVAAQRVHAAADRVLALADDLARARPPIPDSPGPATSVAEDDLIRSFDVSPAATAWLVDPPADFTVVRLAADPNVAVGDTPWGPFAAAAYQPGSPTAAAFLRHPHYLVTAEHSPLPSVDPGEPVLVVGRDIHRHAFARTAVDRLRTEHARVLVVDLGWPSEDRRYADLATFGSSLGVGRALLSLLGRPQATRTRSGAVGPG